MNTNVDNLWKSISKMLEADIKIAASSYEAWLARLEPICIKENAIVLCARNSTVKNMIYDKYIPSLELAARRSKCPYEEFIIITPDEKPEYTALSKPIDIEYFNNTALSTSFTFNKNYTFDNFVVGECNQVAVAAANSAVDNPGTAFNPLLFYGGVGLGKTHLIHAIGNAITEKNPSAKVLYVTAETFTTEFVASIKKTETYNALRNKYFSLDVLMIDDIQFFANRTSTQDALFHIFNELYTNNKQIILSCDRPLQEIKDIQQRLVSRFGWGLITEVSFPNTDTKIEILRKKAFNYHFNIDEDVLYYISQKNSSNIRELESMLQNVIFFIQLHGSTENQLAMAKEALKDYASLTEEKISMDVIISKVSEYFNIPIESIIGNKRTKEIVEPRHIAMYLITKLLQSPSLTAIGQKFNGRDYTTVIYARDKMNEAIQKGESPSKHIVNIESLILNK